MDKFPVLEREREREGEIVRLFYLPFIPCVEFDVYLGLSFHKNHYIFNGNFRILKWGYCTIYNFSISFSLNTRKYGIQKLYIYTSI